MDPATVQRRRQLIASIHNTRQSQARFFLRCSPYMIIVIDNIVYENTVNHGGTPTIGAFGLRFSLIGDK